MYRAFNAVFGKVAPVASPNVVVQLVKTKFLHVLYYAIEVWLVTTQLYLTERSRLIYEKI